MLDYLKQIEGDHDVVFFIPHEEENKIHLETKSFIEKGDKLDGSEIGDCYQIILFKIEEDGTPKHLDMFEAILTKPLEYISTLIPQDWYGVICKKTTTSSNFMNSTFDKLKEV